MLLLGKVWTPSRLENEPVIDHRLVNMALITGHLLCPTNVQRHIDIFTSLNIVLTANVVCVHNEDPHVPALLAGYSGHFIQGPRL